MFVVSASNRRVAAAAGVLFLAVAMHQHAAAAAAQHHVVGGDPGWDVASDVLAWSASRVFMVGDTLWFAHWAVDGGVAEVGSEAEFDSCDVGNPIRMYAEGLSGVGLDGQGFRYFISADPAKCKSGLKLRVDVRTPGNATTASQVEDGAAAPAPASSGTRGVASLMLLLLSLVSVW